MTNQMHGIKLMCIIYIIASPLIASLMVNIRGYFSIGGEGLLLVVVGIYLLMDLILQAYSKKREPKSAPKQVDSKLLRKHISELASKNEREFALAVIDYRGAESEYKVSDIKVFAKSLNLTVKEFIGKYVV